MAITFLHKRVKNQGFSLLEMSIVIIIIGFTIGMGIVTFNQYSRFSKAELTRSRMDVILKAIDDFADKYERLPCPADGGLKLNDENFGLGLLTGKGCERVNYNFGDSYGGIVPVNSLNIYPSFALDGWGNRFTYTVSNKAIESNGVSNPDANIVLTNYEGGGINNVIVVVTSHGENGFNAWRGSGGSQNPESSNDKENDNRGNRHVTSLPIGEFDDIVYFLTRPQILNNDFE